MKKNMKKFDIYNIIWSPQKATSKNCLCGDCKTSPPRCAGIKWPVFTVFKIFLKIIRQLLKKFDVGLSDNKTN